ncbi:hypothetical protein EIL87_12045 [Saccharopolyspora rhizosphaerae]|uniref:Uncharacterized protein n=1 Tax=Saccharopolyspora rhizosphaerae TaxID=2492662 RepID=A0A3R8QB23_9PSEU|nr:hypothetical protein [Saccharopolyspora rhizosphaerae]RRO17003.1 hypothetical protein EIL87_12045 [Saccharopolyspora rhizosphaerae]
MIRERSFNYLVYKWTAGLFGIAFLIALLGFAFPTALPLCFSPEPPIPPAAATVACPTEDSPRAGDYLLVELAGLISAAVTSAGALHEIKGSPTATNVPVALAVLKLPTGALTAVLGIVLLRGEFVPGLSALDTPAQIIAWAVVLGAAQQLFTRFVDARGSAVMRAVPDSNPEPPRKSEEKTPVRA